MIGDDLQSSYSLGDGDCGSSARTRRELELTFTIEAPVAGLRTVLDTTALAALKKQKLRLKEEMTTQ